MLEDMGKSGWNCNWTVWTGNLRKNPIVYSAGVGRDISFEHEMADRFGIRIHLIDPSPTGVETMARSENDRTEFVFHQLALAGHDGELLLDPPPNAEEGSWVSVVSQEGEASADAIRVPCSTMGSLMRKLGHERVDLLKIDVEGAEYGIIRHVLRERVRIDQIAVEYHNGVLPGFSRKQTVLSLIRLYMAGYLLVYKTGSNHTLVHRRCLRGRACQAC